MVNFIKENNPNWYVALSSSINGFDDGQAALIIERSNSLLLDSSFGSINNSNIEHSLPGMHGLHLNEHVACELTLNFVKWISSNFGSAKQKLKQVH